MAGAPAAPPESAALMRALAAHPEQMANLIEALHREASDADTLLNLMGRIAREAVRLLDGVGWAGITAQFDGPPLTAAHTDIRVLVVDERQYAADDGPCLQAMRSGVTVAMTLDQVRRRWPQLAATADRVGVRSFLAVPLRVGDQSVGVLNLYSAADHVPTPDPDLLTVLTEYAGRGLTDYRNHQPGHADQAYRQAVTDQATIEQAIGVLMAVYGFSFRYAKGVLYDQAQDWRRTPTEQAQRIIDDHTPPN
jgi:GAF domain-containing protein